MHCHGAYECINYDIHMPRGSNPVPTEQLRLSTTGQVLALLDGLVATGLFGKNRNEVAEQLIREKLREAVRDGLVRMPGANK